MKTYLYKVSFKTKDLQLNNHFYLIESTTDANAIKWGKFLFLIEHRDISSTVWKSKRLKTNQEKEPYTNMNIDVMYSH